MIRKFQDGDLDAVMQLWLCGNLDAHAFIPEAYWRLNYEAVRDSILQAEIYVYEAEAYMRFCRHDGQLSGGNFCRENFPFLRDWKVSS